MLASQYVSQEGFGGVEFPSTAAYLFQVLIDHLVTSFFMTMQDETDLGQAQTHALAGLNDVELAEMLFCVISMPSTGPVGHDDPFILPVTQHMGSNPEFGGNNSNSH
nr:hypothetical protein [Nesterenkonia ebinurensis]